MMAVVVVLRMRARRREMRTWLTCQKQLTRRGKDGLAALGLESPRAEIEQRVTHGMMELGWMAESAQERERERERRMKRKPRRFLLSRYWTKRPRNSPTAIRSMASATAKHQRIGQVLWQLWLELQELERRRQAELEQRCLRAILVPLRCKVAPWRRESEP